MPPSGRVRVTFLPGVPEVAIAAAPSVAFVAESVAVNVPESVAFVELSSTFVSLLDIGESAKRLSVISKFVTRGLKDRATEVPLRGAATVAAYMYS